MAAPTTPVISEEFETPEFQKIKYLGKVLKIVRRKKSEVSRNIKLAVSELDELLQEVTELIEVEKA